MVVVAVARHRDEQRMGRGEDRPIGRRGVSGFLIGGALLVSLVSFVAGDRIGVHHDVYILIYMTVALGYLGWFIVRSGISMRRLLGAHLWWSLTIGSVVAAAVVGQVMRQAGTGHPHDGFFAFELVWRGVVYGSVDAVVLAVFPAALAYLLLGGNRRGLRRKVAFGALTVLFSLVVSTAYHLGYATYRGQELSKPLIGTVMWDLPAVVTGNPAGAVVAHAAVHGAAVIHQYYGGPNHYLPPELTASYPERGGGADAPALAAAWLALVAVVLVATRDRWSPQLRTSLHRASGGR